MFGTIEKYSGLLFFLLRYVFFVCNFFCFSGWYQSALNFLHYQFPWSMWNFFQFSWKNVFTTFWHNTVVRHLYHSYGHFAFSHHHQCSIKKNTRIIKDGGCSRKPEKDAGLATTIYWGQNQSSQKLIQRETIDQLTHFLRGALWCVTWWRRKYHLFLTVLLHLSQRTSPPTVCMFKIC